jgi:hypothetical protein
LTILGISRWLLSSEIVCNYGNLEAGLIVKILIVSFRLPITQAKKIYIKGSGEF